MPRKKTIVPQNNITWVSPPPTPDEILANNNLVWVSPKVGDTMGWKMNGANCKHATFHSPVPRAKNAQPVNEFCLEGRDQKYMVDSIVYTPHGLIISVGKESQIIPLANVIVARLV